MNNEYLFITPDMLTYQPSTDSPEPDFEDMRILGFGSGQSIEEVLRDILELNENLEPKHPERTFHLDFRNENRKYFNLRDYRSKISIAS